MEWNVKILKSTMYNSFKLNDSNSTLNLNVLRTNQPTNQWINLPNPNNNLIIPSSLSRSILPLLVQPTNLSKNMENNFHFSPQPTEQHLLLLLLHKLYNKMKEKSILNEIWNKKFIVIVYMDVSMFSSSFSIFTL